MTLYCIVYRFVQRLFFKSSGSDTVTRLIHWSIILWLPEDDAANRLTSVLSKMLDYSNIRMGVELVVPPHRCIFVEQKPMTVQDFKQIAEDEVKSAPVHQRKVSC